MAHLAPAHGALVGPGLAGDDVHEGGLARPVGADHRAHLGQADGEADRLLIALNPSKDDAETPHS
jgi:hypothetical protein